jgi:hypothetical protein
MGFYGPVGAWLRIIHFGGFFRNPVIHEFVTISQFFSEPAQAFAHALVLGRVEFFALYETMYRDDRIEVVMELDGVGLGLIFERRERLEILPIETDELGVRIRIEVEFIDGEDVIDVPVRPEIVPRHLVVELKFEPFSQNLFRTSDEGLVRRIDTFQHPVNLGSHDLLETEPEVDLPPLFDSVETSLVGDGISRYDDSVLLFNSPALPLLFADPFPIFIFPL